MSPKVIQHRIKWRWADTAIAAFWTIPAAMSWAKAPPGTFVSGMGQLVAGHIINVVANSPWLETLASLVFWLGAASDWIVYLRHAGRRSAPQSEEAIQDGVWPPPPENPARREKR